MRVADDCGLMDDILFVDLDVLHSIARSRSDRLPQGRFGVAR